ncbi:MAG: ATP-binding protein, partial [Desulfobacteraceae bacterium]
DQIKKNKQFKLLKYIEEGLECPEEFNTKIGPLQNAPSNAIEMLKLRNGHILERLSCPLILEERESGRVWSFRDITEKKKLEVQLFRAQKMEAIGNLAGGIAHDFNNRLQTISGYTQLLMHDEGRCEADLARLNAIERSVRSSCELIDQLLMFSRKIESRLTPIDLNQEVHHIQKILERTLPRMIQIKLNLASDLGIIKADTPQIEQVIMNLAINASHAMPAGGTLIVSSANVKVDEAFCKQHLDATVGKYVRLRVQDNGIGMTKEIIEHIFEPFFTTKFPGKGTGLGLSMVHGIIKNHNGYITCNSIPNQGTCFDLYFPMLDIDPGTLTLQLSAESKMVGGRETILLVEDDEGNLDVAAVMLQRFGYTVLTATDYNETLSIFTSAKTNINLIILDLNMPGTGGEPILKAIRSFEPRAKILIASGFSGLAVKHALAAGASGYIRKPYQMADLLNKVREIIDVKIN